MSTESCREYRPALATWALGQLQGPEADDLVAHLGACETCRDEAGGLTEVAGALRLADPLRVAATPPQPPPTLGEAVSARVAEARARARRGRARALLAAAAVVAVAAVTVAAVGWWPAADGPEPERVPVVVSELAPDLDAEMEMADRGWGASVYITASGLDEGTAYGVWVEDRDGSRSSAGSFLGIGEAELTCYMATAMHLDDVVAIGIDDPDGNPVLRGELAAGRTAGRR